jgi:DNA-binding CsgD family transcriptional regulator
VNPWGLTKREAEALRMFIVTGCEKRTADMMGISMKTVSTLVVRAKQRMGVGTRLHALIEFDRWQRSNA